MRHAPTTLAPLHRFGSPPTPGAIEWEELPSLAARVREHPRIAGAVAESVWDATRPADLDEARVASAPFREPVEGVAVREVIEPDVFRHFFGR